MNKSSNEYVDQRVAEFFKMPQEEKTRKMLKYNNNNTVSQSIENCITAINNDEILEGKLHFNELSNKTDLIGEVPWKRNGAAMDDNDMNNIMLILEKNYDLRSEPKIIKAISLVAREHSYHPIREKLESLEWDGTPRVARALTHFLGVEDTEITAEAMKLFMLGAVSRVFNPGCKFDYIMCIVGAQGVGKSTFFRFLAMDDEWFTDDIKNIDDEQVYQKLAGHFIIELPEMIPMLNAKNAETIKAFISRQKDSYRIPYDKLSKDRPRQCVFCGTSNKIQFLPMDRSGNRRFIPIEANKERAEVHILDNEAESKAYIEQMWAEIMTVYKSGEYSLSLPVHLQKQLNEYQEKFTPEDLDRGTIIEFLDTRMVDYTCVKMIWHEALDHPMWDKAQRWDSINIGDVMDSLPDWEPVKTHKFDIYGKQRAWKRKSRINDDASEEGFMEIGEQTEIPFPF